MSAADRPGWVRPFSNGSQFSDWVERNCHDGCLYYNHDDPACELDIALGLAYLGEGNIPPDIAERLGCNDTALGYPKPECPEKLR